MSGISFRNSIRTTAQGETESHAQGLVRHAAVAASDESQ
jgi:hypothetical protein